jgi:ABC-type amino acid transport substrate-binding protein
MKRRRPFWMSIGLMVSLAFNTGAVLAQSVEPPAKGQSVTIDRIRASGTLRAGAATALPWLGQNPASHEFFGPSVEMGKELADRLGVKLELIPSGYDTIIAGLQANQFDITIAALSATEKRKQVVDFVNYTIAGTCYAVLADNAKVNTLEDLNRPSVSIGTWTGTGTEQVVKDEIYQGNDQQRGDARAWVQSHAGRDHEAHRCGDSRLAACSPGGTSVPTAQGHSWGAGRMHCAPRSAGSYRHCHCQG